MKKIWKSIVVSMIKKKYDRVPKFYIYNIKKKYLNYNEIFSQSCEKENASIWIVSAQFVAVGC